MYVYSHISRTNRSGGEGGTEDVAELAPAAHRDLRPSLRSADAATSLNRGQKIAHQKSTPQKSSWIFSGIFEGSSSRIFQRVVIFPVDFHWNSQRFFTGIFQYIFTSVSSGVQSFAPFKQTAHKLTCFGSKFLRTCLYIGRFHPLKIRS